MPSNELLAAYWSAPSITTNALILLHLAGALALGLLVGYERAYHGRAAGMRTYGLVCMASAALTILAGYPELWYGGHGGVLAPVDPTRIIQGVVTGIGFLGAGVIMREGFNISGLTTAASIWASSAIGILVGVGFYLAAMGLAFFAGMIMICLLCLPFMKTQARATKAEIEESLGTILSRAVRDPNYLMIFIGFFSCGFQLAFVTAHFPALVTEICATIRSDSLLARLGLDTTAELGALSIGVIGLFNIFGTIVAGALGDRYRKKSLLAMIYAGQHAQPFSREWLDNAV